MVYNPTNKDNEEKSAAVAQKRLADISFPADRIERCVAHILATKGHAVYPDSDTNYFTDADLAVLGSDWDKYADYSAAIRREYSIYPDLLYKPGRRKILQHFLAMERIFKTNEFFFRLEKQARTNLTRESGAL